MNATVIGVGLSVVAVVAILVGVGRLASGRRTGIVDLLWALAFATFVADRFAIELLGVGEGVLDSPVLTAVVLVLVAAALVVEYRLTGSIFGGFG